MNKPWYRTRAGEVSIHLAIWAATLSLPYLLDSHHGIPHHIDVRGREQDFIYFNFFTNLLWMGPFYLNAYMLTPWLFYRKRFLYYTLSLLLVFALVFLIHLFLFFYIFNLPHFNIKGAINYLIPTFILTIAISTAFRMVRDKLIADRQATYHQKENLKTELSFLRSQINPHFIFNILNNLVALEQMKSPELGPTILTLSSLMQYMLYETDKERVELSKEIEYLQSYIDLQQQRFGPKVPVTSNLEINDSFFEIEPMLLIPFIENAFKHGIGMIENPTIEINLNVKGDVLFFNVKNRFNKASSEVKDKTSGIGLGNVKRRLELLYGDQHTLDISQNKDWFSVSLKLNLH